MKIEFEEEEELKYLNYEDVLTPPSPEEPRARVLPPKPEPAKKPKPNKVHELKAIEMGNSRLFVFFAPNITSPDPCSI